MQELFKPRFRFDSVLEIKPGFLKSINAKAILLDIDNTLAFHGSQTPFEGVTNWIEEIISSGIMITVISNNTPERVKPFADKLGVAFEANAKKPLVKGLKSACKKMGIEPFDAAVIGDQIFTDVLGGNLLGAKVILTEPLGPDTDKFIIFKRKLEKYIR